MRWLVLMISILVLGCMYGCQNYPARSSGSVVAASEGARVRLSFSDHDRKLIRDYYGHGRQGKLPPGLASKQHLPPGLRKHVRKQGRLPPGLEGRRLPPDLERKLDRLPGDYVRIRVGADILLMERPTRVILDVIPDVPF